MARERAASEKMEAGKRAAEARKAAAAKAGRRARLGRLPGFVRREYECTLDDLHIGSQNRIDCQELHCTAACLAHHDLPRNLEEASWAGMDLGLYEHHSRRCVDICQESDASDWRRDNIEGYAQRYCQGPRSGYDVCPWKTW